MNVVKKKEEWAPIIPYTSIFIDAGWPDFLFAAKECLKLRSLSIEHVNSLKNEISSCFVTRQNPNHALICLSVRTGFDLFFRTQNFPIDSEVIMTAVNIPSMVEIVKFHGLKVIPWDIDPLTLIPSVERLNDLITAKTVVVVFSHLFGKWCRDLEPFLNLTRRRNIFFIEDCAETFLGFDYLGNPSADLTMFSFGIIKFFTCFGGSVVKIRDELLFSRMSAIYDDYPTTSNREYFEKLIKYRFVAMGLNVPMVVRYGVPFFRALGVDHKKSAVNLLRGFPQNELIRKIRRKPCEALLSVMRKRLTNVDMSQFALTKEKGDFVEAILSRFGVNVPGCNVEAKNYWLFPVIVRNPHQFVMKVNRLGVDAFTKASQLNVVDDDTPEMTTPMADDMLKHLVYLPVHKNVPYFYLIKICDAVRQCVECDDKTDDDLIVPIKSKL